MWRAKAMLTDKQREGMWSAAHQVKMIPTLKRITIIPVLLCMEAQAPTCTWVIDLQQSLYLAYKDPMFWQKPQGCLSKPTNRQPHAHHCKTQKTQWISPSGTSLKAVWRDDQAQPLQKDPPQTSTMQDCIKQLEFPLLFQALALVTKQQNAQGGPGVLLGTPKGLPLALSPACILHPRAQYSPSHLPTATE